MRDVFQRLGMAVVLVVSLAALAAAQSDTELFTGGLDSAGPINVQTQLCKLNPGRTMAEYDEMVNDYFEWARENDVEVTFIRQTPYLTHANPANPSGYDFIEFLASDYETAGASWDKWMSTEEGQRLNEAWQSIATCYVKMATLRTQWADVEALNADDERIVTWNWCTPKRSISQLMAKHRSMAESRPEELGNIGWFIYIPRIGGANAPGDFAHIVVYPDVAGLMAGQKWLSDGGWRARNDYLSLYADCTGESANVELVLNRPSQ
jgi:hypothetical protein